MNTNLITKTFKTNNTEIEVKLDLENNTAWLTQNQLAKLFNVSRSWITRQINKEEKNYCFANSVCSDLEHTGNDGKEYLVKHYSLEIILKIGYKIDVDKTLIFKEWIEKKLI